MKHNESPASTFNPYFLRCRDATPCRFSTFYFMNLQPSTFNPYFLRRRDVALRRFIHAFQLSTFHFQPSTIFHAASISPQNNHCYVQSNRSRRVWQEEGCRLNPAFDLGHLVAGNNGIRNGRDTKNFHHLDKNRNLRRCNDVYRWCLGR